MFQAIFLGNLADNAHIERGNNSQFCSFRAASSRKSKDGRTGQDIVLTQWVTVNVNSNYENLMQYLTKGTKVLVMGNMQTRIYTDRAGMQQVGITIQAKNIELCGSPMPANQAPQQAQIQQNGQQQGQQVQAQQQASQGYQQQFQPIPGYRPQGQQQPMQMQQAQQAPMSSYPSNYDPRFGLDEQPF